MKKSTWTPWHKVVALRDDVRNGELSLAVFAADLYDVALGRARLVYQDPKQFFALTYPTYALRELAKDVSFRLAGKNDKAVRQLELTYGGGKTHTLITLYHLVHDPAKLPDLASVDEFRQHIGITPPRARVAILPFDKLDVEKGMEVKAPDGSLRWLKNPWSVLAFQLAGSEGLRLLHPENKAEERDSAPAENLLVPLLAMPQREDLATLILIDEVLMYVHGKVTHDPSWRAKMVNFFQYLTQAVTKVDRAAIVASLLATDPRKSDMLGKELSGELYAIFRREREESVQPVGKDDVAEVLRRRFFTSDSIRDREAFRPHVVAALRGIADLDDTVRKEGKTAEDRFLRSYPFHPDLTETFYTKWVQLEQFQRTRGVLRTFALALRDAEQWDNSPLVAANVFLGEPGKPGLSESGRELANIAATEEYEGKKQEWMTILEGELAKAREIQGEAVLSHREVEQAVFATFLHSQPIGQKALTRDLMLLVGATKPDKIELEKALVQWTDASWFLDEGAVQEAQTSAGIRSLPKVWRLGSKPNLKQMHHDACTRVSPDVIEEKLLNEIGKTKKLTAGASAAGARVHVLPDRPRDVDDDGEFRYVVMGPKAASTAGMPSNEAKRFLTETTSPDKPRVSKNAIILAVPSRDGLELTRQRIREYLGWEEVRSQLDGKELDSIREDALKVAIEQSRKKIGESLLQAYNLAATISDKNEPIAFKVEPGDDELFLRIKKTPQSRIQETAVNAGALLPDGPYDLWHEGDTSRRVKDIVGAFAEFPRLPKMLNRRAILDTLLQGCREGQFVLRLTRPDRSTKTYWRQDPTESDVEQPSMEVVLPEAAQLAELDASLLTPNALPDLWSGNEIALKAVFAYFSGTKVVKLAREGWDEPTTIPKADASVVTRAVSDAVKAGKLWLTSGEASLWGEAVPSGLLTEEAVLRVPPAPVPATDVLSEQLPSAWSGESTTALEIAHALSAKTGARLPWNTVRDAIDGAVRSQLLEVEADSGPWPCDIANASTVKVTARKKSGTGRSRTQPPPSPRPAVPIGARIAEAEVTVAEFQELAEQIVAIKKATAGHDLKLSVRIELGGKKTPSDEIIARVNEILAQASQKLKM